MEVDSACDEPINAVTVRDTARKLPRGKREKALCNMLGSIKGVAVLNFKDFVFTSRITTDRSIYKVAVAMNRLNLASDVQNYDPWSLKWFDHASRLEDIMIVKNFVDGGDLYGATLHKLMRQLALEETVDTNRESTEALKDLFTKESLVEEEEEVPCIQHFPQFA